VTTTWIIEPINILEQGTLDLAARLLELLSNLVFEVFGSCSDLVRVCGFNSVFECDAGNDFGEVVKAA
jgi:hypothetical protein